ncbi:MAG: hypothetical protein Q4G10_05260 [Bacteroidia bacterium]|nr:hypothetical protein [Bacteroidia bacterium]
MKRLPLIVLAGLLSCFGTGCVTALTCGLAELGSGRPCSVWSVGWVTVPLDIITSPLQLPFWIDYGISEYFIDWYYGDTQKRKEYETFKRQLKEDFSVVMRNPKYLQSHNEYGGLGNGLFYCSEYLSGRGNVDKLSAEQAVYVAEKALTDPELFIHLSRIWESQKIGLDLRLRALDYMHYLNYNNGSDYERVFDAPCFPDETLEKIMMSTSSWREQQGAAWVLRSRVQRAAEARKSKRRE